MMIPIKERESFLARLEELAELPPEVARLVAVEEPSKGEPQPQAVDLDAVLTRMLQRAERDGSLEYPARRRLVATTWRWVRGVKALEESPRALSPRRTAEIFREHVLEHLPALNTTELGRDPERTIERLEWALVGIAQAIQGQMPRSLLRTGEGRFRIDWSDDDALGRWEHETAGDSISLRRLAQGCFTSLGGFVPTIAGRLSAEFVRELRLGMPLVGLEPPEGPSQDPTTRRRWLPPEVDLAPEEQFEEAVGRVRDGRGGEAAPEDEGPAEPGELAAEELWLWRADPELATRLDAALCAAALSDYVAGVPSRLEQLNRVVEEHLAGSEGEGAERLGRWLRRREAEAAEAGQSYAGAARKLAMQFSLE